MSGLTLTTAAYHGTTRTNALYKGTKKVWPPAPPVAGGPPEQISGCVLALDATDVPTGAVTSWPDRSPANNDLVPSTGSPTSSAEDYVTCTTANVLATTNPVNVTGAAPRHLFTMIRSRFVGGAFMGYGLGANAALFDLWNFTGQGTLIWHGYGGGMDTVAGAPPFTADVWHLVELSYDGTTFRIYMDEGAPQVATIPGLATAASQFLFGIGRYSPAGDFDMKSFYFYDRVLTGPERDQVRAHMLAEPEPAWTPEALTGLATWLDAADYLPGSWPNKVAGGVTPTIVGTPTMAWSGSTLNGLPTVRFKANEGRLRSTWPSSVHDYTLVYVVRWVGPNAGRAFSAQYPPSNMLIGMHSSYPDAMYDNGTWTYKSTQWPDWGSGPGPWRMYGSDDKTGVGSRFFIDGIQWGTTVVNFGAQNGLYNGWGLSGYDAAGTQETMDIEVAELLLWDRKLSDEERQQAETYLRGKWAVT